MKVEADPRHDQVVVRAVGMEKSNLAGTPMPTDGTDNAVKEEAQGKLLEVEEALRDDDGKETPAQRLLEGYFWVGALVGLTCGGLAVAQLALPSDADCAVKRDERPSVTACAEPASSSVTVVRIELSSLAAEATADA